MYPESQGCIPEFQDISLITGIGSLTILKYKPWGHYCVLRVKKYDLRDINDDTGM